jgi:predicted ribosome quality control (RQC) complex YloA/Tae2 family protein
MKNIEEQNKTQKIQKSIQQLDEMKQQELNQKEEEKKQAESIFLELGLV